MEKYLVFDVETTGLFDFKKPADHPEQPRLAHFNIILANKYGSKLAQYDFMIKPDETWTQKNFDDLESPSNPNHLTRQFLEDHGKPLSEALELYTKCIQDGLIATAYNAQFDLKMMRSELRKAGQNDLFEITKNACLMRPMTPICRIPNVNRGGFKFPKLHEALDHIGYKLENAHSADADTEGARVVLEWLIENELMPEAKVHYAKEGSNASKALSSRNSTKSNAPVKSSSIKDSSIPDSF